MPRRCSWWVSVAVDTAGELFAKRVVEGAHDRRSQARNLWSHRWGASSAPGSSGSRIPRLLTAGGTYVEDIDLPDAAWLTYVRSPHAHARIAAIDTAAARTAPGVLGRVHRRRPRRARTRPAHQSRRTPTRCAGRSSPWARCATSASPSSRSSPRTGRCGADAADLVVVDYEPLACVVDAEAADRRTRCCCFPSTARTW